MKFSVSSSDLLARLQTMGKVIEDKNSLPALTNFHFSLNGEMLVITSANNEMRMTSVLTVNNLDGSNCNICVPGTRLAEYLKNLSDQPVTFSVPEGSLSMEITSLTGRAVQACVSADDYPAEQQPEGEVKSIQMSEMTLLAGINATIFATSNDTLRPVMSGIYMDIEPTQVSFVATDTHKMACYSRTDVNTNDITQGIVISKRTANLLKGILSKTEEPVNISFSEKNVVFESGTYKFSSRLVEGLFPQYKTVIPTNNEARVVVNRTDLVKGLARVSVFVDTTLLVKCELRSNSMHISTQDLDFSCSDNETIPCSYDGNEMSVGFSVEHLTASLNNIEADEVVMSLSDPSRPGIISPSIEKGNEKVLIIIMPMKV